MSMVERRTTMINIPIRTCNKCGDVFVIGYHASAGVTFWFTVLLGIIGGIVYWAARGRGLRCPVCKSRNYDTQFREIAVYG